ncbi:MAG: MFS transporter [Pseudolabrys sp.]|nr:MFS transporter [Pseudolabrys sp.]
MQTKLRPIASLLLGVAFLLVGNGLQFTLLPLRGAAEGFGTFALGLIGSAYYLGFVAGCLLAPYAILRAGHIRAFSAMVALAVTIGLAYVLATNAYAWVAFRLINGFCLAGIYLVIESWLNDRATNETRGLVMSAYVIVNFGAFTVGQLAITLYPIEQAESFMIAAMLASLAIIPVALTRSAQPTPIAIVHFKPVQLFRSAPVGVVASLMVGVANGAYWGLGPISAAGSGLDISDVALFMSAATLAGALAQWPVGRLSDRVDRRIVLLALQIGAAVTGVLLWLTAASGILLMVFGLLFGALALPCYSLAAAHAYDKTAHGDLVPTAATILLVNALGAVIGPLLAAAVMAALDPRALFLFTALAQGLLAAYVAYRIAVQSSLTAAEKTDFDLAATAPVGAMVTGEADPSDSSGVVPDIYQPASDSDGSQENN